MDTLTTEIAASALSAQAVALHRKPALPGFLGRRQIKLGGAGLTPWSLQWVLIYCEAELDWSRADYSNLSRWSDSHVTGYDGPHPEQAHRLPHERMAATVLNAWRHASTSASMLRELILVLKEQRKAADDYSQRETYRAQWHGVSKTTERQIADLWLRRHEAWRVLVKAVAAYRALREEIGPMTTEEAA